MDDRTTSPSKTSAPTVQPEFGWPLGRLRDEIDRLFADFGRPARSVFNFGPGEQGIVPAIEITEHEDGYRLTAELPGLKPEDLDVSIAEGVLTLSGEKKEEQERKEKGYVMSERRYGSFRRQVQLPRDVEPASIKAEFKDGLLTVMLPKDGNAASRTRKIEIAKA